LRFTCPISLGELFINDLLPVFSAQCPEVQLELAFSNVPFEIVNGDQDSALRASEQLNPDVVAKYLGRIEDVVVASPQFLKTHSLPQHPQQLVEFPCIKSNHQTLWNQWQFAHRETNEPCSVLVNSQLAVNQYTSMRQIALSGFAVAKLPRYLVDADIKNKRLCQLLTDWKISTHPLYVLHARHQVLPKKLRLFKTFLESWFANSQGVLA